MRSWSSNSSAGKTVHTPVDVDDLAGDVTRERRRQKRDEVRHVFGLAEVTDRNVRVDERAPVLGRRVQALQDLLAVDAPGRQAVDGDAVARELARQSLRPVVQRGFRYRRDIDVGRLV